MSNTMTAHEQPISYLDSILNEEESRCEYSHQWRNFTISRSGRFKSKNRKRDVVDGKLFDANNAMPGATSAAGMSKSNSSASAAGAGHNRVTAMQTPNAMMPHYKQDATDKNAYRQPSSISNKVFSSQTATSSAANSSRSVREKTETYKSYYETNL